MKAISENSIPLVKLRVPQFLISLIMRGHEDANLQISIRPELAKEIEVIESLFKTIDPKHEGVLENRMFGSELQLENIALNPKKIEDTFFNPCLVTKIGNDNIEFLKNNPEIVHDIIEVLMGERLIKALGFNDYKVVSLLFRINLDLITSARIEIAFFEAVKDKNISMVKSLLKLNPDLANIQYDYASMLFWASQTCDKEIFKTILEYASPLEENVDLIQSKFVSLFYLASDAHEVAALKGGGKKLIDKLKEEEKEFILNIFKNYVSKNILTKDLNSYYEEFNALYSESLPSYLLGKMIKHLSLQIHVSYQNDLRIEEGLNQLEGFYPYQEKKQMAKEIDKKPESTILSEIEALLANDSDLSGEISEYQLNNSC